jgi:hypothetical protein
MDVTAGGGGGGGYSYLIGGAFSPGVPTGQAAEVTISYDAPTADLSGTQLGFGTVPLGITSVEQTITVTNNGSAPLVVSGYSISGADPGDFLISNRCDLAHVGGTCQIGVRFDPQATGTRSASLTLLTNAAAAPSAITLSGTGGSLPQGPQGEQGPPGPAGKVELITCRTITKTVRHHRHKITKCTGKLVSGPIKFTTASAHATISRAGRVYATGTSISTGRPSRLLVMRNRHDLAAGLYTLTLRARHAHRWVTRRAPIMFI